MDHIFDLTGQTIGDYLVYDKLGSGGMATVYKGQDLEGQKVALKVLSPGLINDKQSVERFRREALQVSRLRHPNIIKILDYGVHDTLP